MANTVVRLLKDLGAEFGCKGDIYQNTEEQMTALQARAKKLGLAAKEAYEVVGAEERKAMDAAKKEVELTSDTIKQYVKAHSRADLEEQAVAAGVESPEKLPNATTVAQAILDKQS